MTSPAWARGYDLGLLKEITAVFARAHKPYVYGAFGVMKERDIANALADGSLVVHKNGSGTDSAFICTTTRGGSGQRDFTSAVIPIPAGTRYIKSLVLGEECGIGSDKTVAEIFEEDIVTRAKLVDEGFQYVAGKVTAGGDLKGLYSNFEIHYGTSACENATLVCLKPNFLPHDIRLVIRDELAQYAPWAQHYSSYNKRQSWTAFALRGFDPTDSGFIIKPAEMSQKWKRENPQRLHAFCDDTELANKFQTVWKMIHYIPCAGFERVRFMRLRAKDGELSRHADITDRAAGTNDGHIMRLHIPIITSPAVEFCSWDMRGTKHVEHMKVGSLWYLDTRKPHMVRNPGDTERIHLVVDVVANSGTRQWLTKAL